MGRFANLEFEGQDERAASIHSAAQEIRDEAYFLRLADQCYRSARFEEALRHYSRALEFNANVHAAWVGQVQMLIEMGELQEAKLWADKALEVHRDHPELLSGKAIAWARLGDSLRAVQFSDAAVAQRGTTPYVWLARGEALLSDLQAADEHCFEKASSEDRHHWFMRLQIARACFWHREFSRAMAWITKAARQERAPFVLHTLGECQLALGMADDAARSYAEAVFLDPGFAPSKAALEGLRNCGMLGGAWNAVRGALRRVIG